MAQADPSTETNPNTTSFLSCLDAAQRQDQPFTYWLLRDVLTEEACQEVVDLPVSPPKHADYPGMRDSHNESRSFFNPETCARHPVCGTVVETFSDPRVRGAIEQACGIDLSEGQLRIEYTQDVDGFWLEPHTDISVKLFTMLIYLSNDPEAAGWGTDIYDTDHKHVGTAPYGRNLGLIFIPGDDTWHGVRKRPIKGVRRSLIVNYVTQDWRARHELAAP